jgi:pyridoxal phosphate enzyme (YggS family)
MYLLILMLFSAILAVIMKNFDYIKENIFIIKDFLRRVNPAVKLLAVTKTLSVDAVKAAISAGLNEFGESRVQEAEPKIGEINSSFSGIKWHDIGNLQANKVNKAARLFGCIQSVDSLRLAEKLSTACVSGHVEMEVLLELKVSPEASKSGFSEHDIIAAAVKVSGMPGLILKGIMTIAPFSEQADKARPFFKKARNVFDELGKIINGGTIDTLSMGMTGDYMAAIDEGSTMVRIGTGIFGSRKSRII